ncbi:exopolysaccharide transport family protein [Siansivirga zeaxanthinifaciens]|uniref:non-specific protein-tyrosine kinase n=1 Tax=Siansivirga zeaxanthinifaciens CC-SAMT-1 TaxID=1454006 RepID=A0A0C5VXG6_9FLAO|nr:tyrosine-protein kinase [Siansivirga zeaxanthinifaciens]AJR03786.1 sugar transporter [Siansivirga zeaxanthinifaciens CC-SAMT-1]
MEDGAVEQQGQLNFDFKAFFFRLLSYWKWFLLILIIGVYIVYQQNIRKEFPYTLSASISVQDDKNPLFTSNTNLIFNYGGISGKVQDVVLNLNSRKHHELVVDSLQFYLNYFRQDRFYKTDIYKQAPFEFVGDANAFQVLGHFIQINFISEEQFELSYDLGEATAVTVQNFETKAIKTLPVETSVFKEVFSFYDAINLPFFKGRFVPRPDVSPAAGQEFFIQYTSFNAAVSQYANSSAVLNEPNSPLLTLRLTHKNKAKIVDYLNTSVFILDRELLQRKNQYAINTVAFIDKQLARVKEQLSRRSDSLNDFKQSKKIFDINRESNTLVSKIEAYENQKQALEESILSYDLLKNYLETSNDFTNFPAPALQGISDGTISGAVSKIVTLSIEKSKLSYSVRNDVAVFDDLNRQIEGLKKVIYESISSNKNNIRFQIRTINSNIYKLEREFSVLPENKLQLQGIEREYLLSQNTYNLYLAKRGEADLIKASNISDIIFIEPAKDIGQGRNVVNLNIRYVFAVFGAFIPVFLMAFLVTFFDTKFHGPNDLEKHSTVPLLAVVGKSQSASNLAVIDKPKSAIAEAFRSVRSSLQFIYKKQGVTNSKTVMLTSSVSGEGKTFCSINIASVFALSGKKTVLVGLDLRKPKIFDDFGINNKVGAVNYLIGQATLAEITQSTHVEHLDVITSGPIPPNPSELLIGDYMDAFMSELKATYDYIVLDTPPIGLVSDALELIPYVDATLYVVRQDYTKKDMLKVINSKYKKGEIKNISFLYNYFNQKGTYGYGYGYGYGAYGNGYHEDAQKASGFLNSLKTFFKRLKP